MAALHRVEKQEQAVVITKLAKAKQVLYTGGHDATLSLYAFNHYSCGLPSRRSNRWTNRYELSVL